MANWLQGLFLFCAAVAVHWAALVTGGFVTAGVMVIEKRRQASLSWQSYSFTFTVFLLFACFQAWQDEHKNTLNTIKDKAELSALSRECSFDLKTTRLNLADKDSVVGSLQTAIAGFAGPQAQQAANISTCINTLAKMNPIVSREIKVSEIDDGSNAIGDHVLTLAVSTNKISVASGRLHCERPFEPYKVSMTMDYVSIKSIDTMDKILENEYHIGINGNRLFWNTETPILIVVISKFDNLMPCSFRIDEGL